MGSTTFLRAASIMGFLEFWEFSLMRAIFIAKYLSYF